MLKVSGNGREICNAVPQNVTPAPNAGHPTARAIRAAREYAGLSRAQVASALQVDAATIGRYERGQWTKPIKRPVLEAIARRTGAPLDFLEHGWPDAATRFEAELQDAARTRRQPPEGEGTDGARDGRSG